MMIDTESKVYNVSIPRSEYMFLLVTENLLNF